MGESTAKMREQMRLRRVAEGLLAGGQAPPSRGCELGTDHPVAYCDVHANDAAADAPRLRITARIEPGSNHVWMIIS